MMQFSPNLQFFFDVFPKLSLSYPKAISKIFLDYLQDIFQLSSCSLVILSQIQSKWMQTSCQYIGQWLDESFSVQILMKTSYISIDKLCLYFMYLQVNPLYLSVKTYRVSQKIWSLGIMSKFDSYCLKEQSYGSKLVRNVGKNSNMT